MQDTLRDFWFAIPFWLRVLFGIFLFVVWIKFLAWILRGIGLDQLIFPSEEEKERRQQAKELRMKEQQELQRWSEEERQRREEERRAIAAKLEEQKREETEREKKRLQQEKAEFYERRWTPRDASWELKKYQRELDRRQNNLAATEFHFPHLSTEEIHQRIDFLELGRFPHDDKKRIPDAKLRTTFESWCDQQMRKRIATIKRREGLTNTPEDDYTPQQKQKIKGEIAHWQFRKQEGPPRGWIEPVDEEDK